MKKPKVFYIYVLNLEGGNYYVGSTANLTRRLKTHFSVASGKSSVWCKKHKPLSVVHTQGVFGLVADAINLEDQFALRIAKAVGVERVRGGKLSGNTDCALPSWSRFFEHLKPMPMHKLIPLSEVELLSALNTKSRKRSIGFQCNQQLSLL